MDKYMDKSGRTSSGNRASNLTTTSEDGASPTPQLPYTNTTPTAEPPSLPSKPISVLSPSDSHPLSLLSDVDPPASMDVDTLTEQIDVPFAASDILTTGGVAMDDDNPPSTTASRVHSPSSTCPQDPSSTTQEKRNLTGSVPGLFHLDYVGLPPSPEDIAREELEQEILRLSKPAKARRTQKLPKTHSPPSDPSPIKGVLRQPSGRKITFGDPTPTPPGQRERVGKSNPGIRSEDH